MRLWSGWKVTTSRRKHQNQIRRPSRLASSWWALILFSWPYLVWHIWGSILSRCSWPTQACSDISSSCQPPLSSRYTIAVPVSIAVGVEQKPSQPLTRHGASRERPRLLRHWPPITLWPTRHPETQPLRKWALRPFTVSNNTLITFPLRYVLYPNHTDSPTRLDSTRLTSRRPRRTRRRDGHLRLRGLLGVPMGPARGCPTSGEARADCGGSRAESANRSCSWRRVK